MNRGENEETKTMMSVSVAEPKETKETTNQTKLAIADYDNGTFSSTLMYSYLLEHEIFKVIRKWLDNQDIKSDLHPKKWRLTYHTQTETQGPDEKEPEKINS